MAYFIKDLEPPATVGCFFGTRYIDTNTNLKKQQKTPVEGSAGGSRYVSSHQVQAKSKTKLQTMVEQPKKNTVKYIQIHNP